ncbi:MAG: DUF177 domain-containing protein [Paludibacter sp.]|jgi:uncharacterized metal-binding protein YceD (DUF177 family)|nr:DUF177 domain-containing protein [Paludibacter sp.]
MSKFALYNIDLKNITENSQAFHFVLDDDYFKKIDSPEVQRGNINAQITVNKKPENAFELKFLLDGYVIVPCDRCLDDMHQPISYKENLMVKFGSTFTEEGEVVVVPETEGAINVAWFLYEFIVTNIPIKHVHPSGECNKTMMSKLKRHIAHSKDETEEEADDIDVEDEDEDITPDDTSTDPRWDGLKNILD